MEKQKKLIEMVFFGVVFIALVVFLVFNGIQPKEELPAVYEPPLVGVPALPPTPQSELAAPDNKEQNGAELPNTTEQNGSRPLLPQNIPYWELD